MNRGCDMRFGSKLHNKLLKTKGSNKGTKDEKETHTYDYKQEPNIAIITQKSRLKSVSNIWQSL